MSQANLLLMQGAREVTSDELATILCPPAEGRWRPVPHGTVLTYATSALEQAGFGVEQMKLGVSRGDQRFFGSLVLNSPIAEGVSLAVGVRSSYDKSIALEWCCGSHVLVCDNMAFTAQTLIARKHTKHGPERYLEAIQQAVTTLVEYRRIEMERIRRMQESPVADATAEAFLLRAYHDEKLLGPAALPVAIQQWREPSFAGLEAKNVWRLFNAVTFAIGPRFRKNPQAATSATIRLSALLTPGGSEAWLGLSA